MSASVFPLIAALNNDVELLQDIRFKPVRKYEKENTAGLHMRRRTKTDERIYSAVSLASGPAVFL